MRSIVWCHSLIQLASWAVMTMCSPHTLHPSLVLSVMFRREGSAGPVYPITAPFSKHPRVAQNVAKTFQWFALINEALCYHQLSPVSFCCGERIVEDHCCSLEHPRSLCPDCLDLSSWLLLILTPSHSTQVESIKMSTSEWFMALTTSAQQSKFNNHKKKRLLASTKWSTANDKML